MFGRQRQRRAAETRAERRARISAEMDAAEREGREYAISHPDDTTAVVELTCERASSMASAGREMTQRLSQEVASRGFRAPQVGAASDHVHLRPKRT